MKHHTFTTTELGHRYELGPVRITREKMTAFARDYDPLPLHYDEQYAKTTRYGAVIAPGVMTFMSVWAEFIRLDLWGPHILGGKNTTIEWFAPVYADDSIRGVSVITAKNRRNKYNGVIEITSEYYNQHGDCVMGNITELVIAD